jgi:hypothetical protein
MMPHHSGSRWAGLPDSHAIGSLSWGAESQVIGTMQPPAHPRRSKSGSVSAPLAAVGGLIGLAVGWMLAFAIALYVRIRMQRRSRAACSRRDVRITQGPHSCCHERLFQLVDAVNADRHSAALLNNVENKCFLLWCRLAAQSLGFHGQQAPGRWQDARIRSAMSLIEGQTSLFQLEDRQEYRCAVYRTRVRGLPAAIDLLGLEQVGKVRFAVLAPGDAFIGRGVRQQPTKAIFAETVGDLSEIAVGILVDPVEVLQGSACLLRWRSVDVT